MYLNKMLELGKDMILTSICSTPNHKMIRVQCKIVGLVVRMNPNTLLL